MLHCVFQEYIFIVPVAIRTGPVHLYLLRSCAKATVDLMTWKRWARIPLTELCEKILVLLHVVPLLPLLLLTLSLYS